MHQIALLPTLRQPKFKEPPLQVKKPAENWPEKLRIGVHSLDPSALIVPNLPESLLLNRAMFERSERFRSRPGYCLGGPGLPAVEPLVYNSISSRHLPEHCFVPTKTSTYYQVYNRDVYLCRHAPQTPPTEPTNNSRSAIELFSKKSRANLRHVCDNSGHRVRSQFCLTYHENYPMDGRETKRHLRAFLKVAKRTLPHVGHLWVLEFQERNAPHYHIFFTVLPTEEQHETLAAAWVCITNGTDEQLKWHLRKQTCKPWKMSGSSYLLKEYAVKIAQKDVPKEYINVGRFWGNSKDMQPIPQIFTPEQIASETKNDVIPWEPAAVEHYVARNLRKWQENQMNRDRNGNRRTDEQTGKVQSWKKAAFIRQESTLNGNFKIINGTKIFNRLMHYIAFNAPDKWSISAANRVKIPF